MREGKMRIGRWGAQTRHRPVPCSLFVRRCFVSGSFASSLVLLLILIVGAFPCEPRAQEDTENPGPGLTALLDRDSAAIGSVVTLILNYRLPDGAGFADIPEIGGLEELTPVDREIGLNQIRIKLLVDRLGAWTTGPLSLDYLDEEGKPQTVSTDPVSLTVLSNLGETPEAAELRAIQGIIPTKGRWLNRLPWVGAGIAFLLTALAIVWWYRTRRRGNLLTAAMDPPHIRAVKEIEALEGRKLFEQGHAKAFYFSLSEILRRYLEAIRGFPAAEFTTEEIAHHIETEPDRRLLPLLRQADLVKFADFLPTPAGKTEALEAALNYIEDTRPHDEAEKRRDGSRRQTS